MRGQSIGYQTKRGNTPKMCDIMPKCLSLYMTQLFRRAMVRASIYKLKPANWKIQKRYAGYGV